MENKTVGDIKVSVSTDAIIYLPFYLAYFGGDFEDTPYGPVNVQIVGLNDIRFKNYDEDLGDKDLSDNAESEFKYSYMQSKSERKSDDTEQKPVDNEKKQKSDRLRGDAFMTLDVLYGVADIGLGDVGFVPILRNDKERNEIFIDTDGAGKCILTEYAKSLNRGMANNLGDICFVTEYSQALIGMLHDKVKKTDLKIVGGLIRKPALKCLFKKSLLDKIDIISKYPNNPKDEYEKHFSEPYEKRFERGDKNLIRNKERFKNEILSDSFLRNFPPSTHVADLELINKLPNPLLQVCSYRKPSTSYYYIGKIIQNLPNNEKWKYIDVNFGDEINEMIHSRETIGCFSCDFVALRYANKEENKVNYKDFVMVDDWTCMDTNILWSGFILDEKKYKNKEKAFCAFFYAIDQCMFRINQYLKNDDSHGLHYYIKSKLTDKDRLNDVFRVLIADDTIIPQTTTSRDLDIRIDQIIRHFIKDLFYCKNSNYDANFYYRSLNIYEQPIVKPNNELDNTYVQKKHIMTLMKLRDNSANEVSLNDCIQYDIMADWYQKEGKINQFKNKHKILYSIFSKDYGRIFAIIVALVGIMSLLEAFTKHGAFNIWEKLVKCDESPNWYAFISLIIFLLLLSLTGYFIYKKIIPKIDLLEKEGYVIDCNRKVETKRKKLAWGLIEKVTIKTKRKTYEINSHQGMKNKKEEK